MDVQWSDVHGAYLFVQPKSTYSVHSSWTKTTWSLLEKILDYFNKEILSCKTTKYGTRELITFDLSLSGLPVCISMRLDTVRAASILCFIGIGIGVGFTSWFLYRVYHRAKRKYKRKSYLVQHINEIEDEELINEKGLNGLQMGGGNSQLSAGFGYSDSFEDSETYAHVRHRHIISGEKHTPLGASIVESDSGAYISRTCVDRGVTVSNTGINVPNISNSTSTSESASAEIVHNVNGATRQRISANDEVQLNVVSHESSHPIYGFSMKDSGFLDNGDLCTDKISLDCNNDNHSITLPAMDNRSRQSSISDQANLDLLNGDRSSGENSSRASYERELDEDILQVELDVYATNISGASTQTLLGSLQELTIENYVKQTYSDSKNIQENEVIDIDKMLSKENTISGKAEDDSNFESSQTLHETTSSHGSCTDSKETLSADPLDNVPIDEYLPNSRSSTTSSPFCGPFSSSSSSPYAFRQGSEDSWSSGAFSPHLLRKDHSRTSSITSADIEVEAGETSCESVAALEDLEIEVQTLKEEINQIENHLNTLCSVDTTELYFNVDGLNRLTHMVMSSDNIEITSSEIAKAFHILRKYRYNFTPDRHRKPFTWCEAETPPAAKNTSKQSLSHLDLADVSSTPRKESSTPSRSSYDEPEVSSNTDLNGINTDSSQLDSHHNCSMHNSLSTSPKSVSLYLCKFDMLSYASAEWTGNTPKAHAIRQGYQAIAEKYKYKYLYRVRGDNYCALRASLCSALLHHQQLAFSDQNIELITESLVKLFTQSHAYMKSWTFGGRLPPQVDVLSTCKLCLKTFFTKVKAIASLDKRDREEHINDLINYDSSVEVLMLEAIKLLMQLKAVEMYDLYTAGHTVPIFVWLMFARDTSSNPRHLFQNHINQVGDFAGLEQVDMCLLGESLGVQLQVFRPSQIENEDFVSFYPKDTKESIPMVPLVAEDDRHYNFVI